VSHWLPLLNHIGSLGSPRLSRFSILQTCRYLENVPAIVPLLEREFRSAAAKLEATQVRCAVETSPVQLTPFCQCIVSF